MSDDNKVAETITAVEGLFKAIPVYQDLLQPAVKEIGISLETVAKCVNVALTPISTLVWGYDRIKEFVDTKVAEKLAGVPNERIVTPKPEVAGPALEALRYTGHDDTLRELYANLLATAMDAATVEKAHPAFVEIIKNLSPDEARIMRLFAVRGKFPIIDVHQYRGEQSNQYNVVIVNHSHVGKEAGCEHLHLTQAYIDNLCRVRLLEIAESVYIAAPDTYEPLENDSLLKDIKIKAEKGGLNIRFARKILQITVWGQMFSHACVVEKSAT
jgi:Abortive infection alpha